MSIAFQCNQCGKSYAADDRVAGKAMKCKACGQVIRIPGTPASKAAAPPPRPAGPPPVAAKVPPPIPKAKAAPKLPTAPPPPSADLDLFGLDDEPTPAMRAASAAAGGGDEAPLTLPRAGTPPRPKTKDEKKKFEKRVKKADRERGSFAQPAFGISFGTALMATLFMWRWYNRINRATRAFNHGAAASAEEDPGSTPRAPRVVGTITAPAFPDLGPGRPVAPGVMLHEVRLGPPNPAPAMPGHRGKLWVYLPAGNPAPGSLPCIVIAGAGTPLIWGMDLGDGDRAEHIPYAQNGFAVVAYELDGAYDDENDDADENACIEAFLVARAGLVNAHNAIEYALAKVPQVDPSRLFAVGHSSAGTLSLLLAENEPRLAGCVAFAPAVDTGRNFGPDERAQLARVVPGAGDFFTRYNPMMHEADIHCPVFLFHAMDDSNVPAGESQQCKARLDQLGKPATLETVPNGDHYQAMIAQGIPRAIQWLKAQPPRASAPGVAPPTPGQGTGG